MAAWRLLPVLVLASAALAGPARAGGVVAWGDDGFGQVTNAPPGTDFVSVAGAGAGASFALRADGSIVAWGRDLAGEVSDAPTGTGFKAIAAGYATGYALRTDGSIVAWGYGADGELLVPSGAGFTAIAAGVFTGYALRADGSIVAWGYNAHSQVSGAPPGTGFKAIAAGSDCYAAFALRADRSIAAWGFDGAGQVSGAPPGTGFGAIAGGVHAGYALRADGSIAAWGTSDTEGQLSGTPPGAGFVAIAAGVHNAYALRADGSIVPWGRNTEGEVSGVPSGSFVAVSAGDFNGYAVTPPPPWSGTIAVDTGGYTGRWTIDDVWHEGNAVVSITPGSHYVRVAWPSSFDIDVGTDGSVTVLNGSTAATGGAAHLTFNTATIDVVTNGYPGGWGINEGPFPLYGDHSVTLVRGLEYMLRVGWPDGFTISIDASGNVSSPTTVPATCSGHTISLHTTTVNVVTNGYPGGWGINEAQFPLYGDGSVTLVPGLEYMLRVAWPDGFTIAVDADGNVSSPTSVPADCSGHTVSLHTTVVNVVTNGYTGRWGINEAQFPLRGDGSVTLVPGLEYGFRAGWPDLFSISVDAGGNVTTAASGSATWSGATLSLVTVDVRITPSATIHWSLDQVVDAYGSWAGKLVGDLDYDITAVEGLPGLNVFHVSSPCGVDPVSLARGPYAFTLECVPPPPAMPEITIDPGAYQGQWQVDDGTPHYETTVMALSPGTHYVRVASWDVFYFSVDAAGNVSTDKADSATASGSTLTLRNTSLTIDPQASEFFWYLTSWVYPTYTEGWMTGPRTLTVVPGLTYNFSIGTQPPPDHFLFSIDGGGNVTTAKTDSAYGSFQRLTLRNTTLFVDAGAYEGYWYLTKGWMTGSRAVQVVPALTYSFAVGEPDHFAISIDAVGNVTTAKTDSAATALNTLSLIASTVRVDPGGYAGYWDLKDVRYNINGGGARTFGLVVGMDYQFVVGGTRATFHFNDDRSFTPNPVVCNDVTFTLECPSVSNTPPTAVPGPNQTIHAGDPAALDGRGSTDSETPDQLTYAWSLDSGPAGTFSPSTDGGATSTSARPMFTPSAVGTYVIKLAVTDGGGLSASATLTLSSENAPPNADAGPFQGAYVGETVTLDGSGSGDTDLDPITFAWTLTAKPAGSAVALSPAAAATASPSFTPDMAGDFTFQLVVDDGFTGSTPSPVTIHVVSAAQFAATAAATAINEIGSLPASMVTTAGNRTALRNFVSQALSALNGGNVALARDRLRKAIERTDGVFVRGRPDPAGGGPNPPAQDYVTNPAEQLILYDLLSDALTALGG